MQIMELKKNEERDVKKVLAFSVCLLLGLKTYGVIVEDDDDPTQSHYWMIDGKAEHFTLFMANRDAAEALLEFMNLSDEKRRDWKPVCIERVSLIGLYEMYLNLQKEHVQDFVLDVVNAKIGMVCRKPISIRKIQTIFDNEYVRKICVIPSDSECHY